MKPIKIFIKAQLVILTVLVSMLFPLFTLHCTEILEYGVNEESAASGQSNNEVQTGSNFPAEEHQEITESDEKILENEVDELVSVSFLKLPDNPDGSSVVLIRDQQEVILVVSGTSISGLGKTLKEEKISHIDHLILSDGGGQAKALKEILSACSVSKLYSTENEEIVPSESEQDLSVETSDYFDTENAHVIMYRDEDKNLGILVYTPDCAMFIADSIEDMSELEDHTELKLLSVLSISESTGLDANVLKLMDPDACIVSGDVKDIKNISAFYGTFAAEEGKFYLQDNAAKGISFDMANSLLISGAVPKMINISRKAETDGSAVEKVSGDFTGSADESKTDAGNENIQDDSDNSKKANEEMAEEVKNGLWGNGEDRYNRLREAGYDPYEIQAIVDGTAGSDPEDISGNDVEKPNKESETSTQDEDEESTNVSEGVDSAESPQYVTAAIFSFPDANEPSEIIEVPYGDEIPVSKLREQEGILFDGWYTDRELKHAYTADMLLVDNISLYPKQKTVTLTLDPNGADGELTEITFEYGGKEVLPSNTFIRNGFTFKGWSMDQAGAFKDKDGSYRIYGDGEPISNILHDIVEMESDLCITLYAQWEPIYEVTWGNNQTVISGQEAEYFMEGDISRFMSAGIDTELLLPADVFADGTENEVHIIISADTLNLLEPGDHKISFNFTDGSCEAWFTLADPQIKENAIIVFWESHSSVIVITALIILAASALVIVVKRISGKAGK